MAALPTALEPGIHRTVAGLSRYRRIPVLHIEAVTIVSYSPPELLHSPEPISTELGYSPSLREPTRNYALNEATRVLDGILPVLLHDTLR